MTVEILTIHHLFDWGRQTVRAASALVEQTTVRANGAVNRAESANAVASLTAGQAEQLEITIGRFSSLNMDPASLAAMNAALDAAVHLVHAEQRRAAAETAAAEAAKASATAADLYRQAVIAMNDIVHMHQTPHAEAQAATGNAAAHSSVLEPS